MKNLNSKKARKELSDLFNSIQVESWMIDDFLEDMTASRNQNDWEIHKANFDRAITNKNNLIIELVEVYGIHHTCYKDIIKEREEQKLA